MTMWQIARKIGCHGDLPFPGLNGIGRNSNFDATGYPRQLRGRDLPGFTFVCPLVAQTRRRAIAAGIRQPIGLQTAQLFLFGAAGSDFGADQFHTKSSHNEQRGNGEEQCGAASPVVRSGLVTAVVSYK